MDLNAEKKKWKSIVIIFIFLIGVVLIGLEYVKIQEKFIALENGKESDVIPSLMLYVKRFLAGEYLSLIHI